MVSPDDPPTKADEYHHTDGTVEVVFAVEGDSVLTVREYPSRSAFQRTIEDATDAGTHADVADIPDVEAFRQDNSSDSDSARDDQDRDTLPE